MKDSASDERINVVVTCGDVAVSTFIEDEVPDIQMRSAQTRGVLPDF